MSHIFARCGIKKAKKGLGQINPNLLVGGAIVGIVGLGAVLLWRALDPRQIPDKLRESLGDQLIENAAKTGWTDWDNKVYTQTDPNTGEIKADWKNTLLFIANPLAGLAYGFTKSRRQSIPPPPPTPPGIPPVEQPLPIQTHSDQWRGDTP